MIGDNENNEIGRNRYTKMLSIFTARARFQLLLLIRQNQIFPLLFGGFNVIILEFGNMAKWHNFDFGVLAINIDMLDHSLPDRAR